MLHWRGDTWDLPEFNFISICSEKFNKPNYYLKMKLLRLNSWMLKLFLLGQICLLKVALLKVINKSNNLQSQEKKMTQSV